LQSALADRGPWKHINRKNKNHYESKKITSVSNNTRNKP
jgi:hypothetical protein